jgi:NADH dehydrogenase FAD-containing subunit
VTERIVVIGADAAGMSAASQAKRIAGDAVEIVAFERGTYSPYAACGIPYWVAGDVDEPSTRLSLILARTRSVRAECERLSKDSPPRRQRPASGTHR